MFAKNEGGMNVRIPSTISTVVVIAFALPATAQPADQGVRQQIEGLVATYAENFNKHENCRPLHSGRCAGVVGCEAG
jgi:hypothetical protein